MSRVDFKDIMIKFNNIITFKFKVKNIKIRTFLGDLIISRWEFSRFFDEFSLFLDFLQKLIKILRRDGDRT